MEGFERHPDNEVNTALVRLCDTLCMWERNTGRTSALVLREKPDYNFRAASGKPGIPDFINDSDFIFGESGQTGQNDIKEDSQNDIQQQQDEISANIIESTDPCEYCVHYKGDNIDCDCWKRCIESVSQFKGQKLRPC